MNPNRTSSFMQSWHSCIYQPCTLNKVQYPADRGFHSPHYMECLLRSLNVNVTEATQSQRKCETVLDARLHRSHLEPLTSPSLNKCVFKWQCPATNPVIILNRLLLKLTKSPVSKRFFFLRRLQRQIILLKPMPYGSFYYDVWGAVKSSLNI
jgi:hypothetical protein